MNQLPASVQEIADVIGRERALFLVGQLPRYYRRDTRWPSAKTGELILYVPKRMTDSHKLAALLGWQDAQKLVRAFGGEILKPASCAEIYRPFRDAGAVAMVAAGESVAVVAALMGVCRKHIENLTKEIPREEKPAVLGNVAAVDTAGDAKMDNGYRRKRKSRGR